MSGRFHPPILALTASVTAALALAAAWVSPWPAWAKLAGSAGVVYVLGLTMAWLLETDIDDPDADAVADLFGLEDTPKLRAVPQASTANRANIASATSRPSTFNAGDPPGPTVHS